MSRIDELEHKLDEQQHRIDRKRHQRDYFRKLADAKDAQVDDLRDKAEDARDERDGNQLRLVHLRDEIADVEKGGVTEDEEARLKRLNHRLEGYVDDNEEITALLARVLPRLHEQAARADDVKDLERRFGQALDHAIARKRKIERALHEAQHNASSNPLDTPYFVVAEFDCHNGVPVPAASIPALKDHVHRYLLPLRSSFGEVRINSAFRTYAYNISIGGASLSVHVYDGPWQHSPWACAVDHVTNVPPGTVQTWHESHTHPDGMGRYSSFTHVDNRNRLGWVDSRWNGP